MVASDETRCAYLDAEKLLKTKERVSVPALFCPWLRGYAAADWRIPLLLEHFFLLEENRAKWHFMSIMKHPLHQNTQYSRIALLTEKAE